MMEMMLASAQSIGRRPGRMALAGAAPNAREFAIRKAKTRLSSVIVTIAGLRNRVPHPY
jgi:hypothetical protein